MSFINHSKVILWQQIGHVSHVSLTDFNTLSLLCVKGFDKEHKHFEAVNFKRFVPCISCVSIFKILYNYSLFSLSAWYL